MTHVADAALEAPPVDLGFIENAALRARVQHLYGTLVDALAGRSPVVIARIESELDLLARELARDVGVGRPIHATLETWREMARAHLRVTEPRSSTLSPAGPSSRPPERGGWMSFFARNSSSFRFAASFMPQRDQARIAGVYAWCRFTDDLVDRFADGDSESRLDEWLAASRAAYNGDATGVDLLDDVMTVTRERGVPFYYAAELIAGMRMDLRHRVYADDIELSLYTWRAAGTVGRWLAESHGVRDPWSLERAAALGQAMQLTNIVRDVGEDLARGRLYIPLARLEEHGLTPMALMTSLRSGSLPSHGWQELLEGMMAEADRHYEFAWPGLERLPNPFRRAATVSAAVYRGIHDAIRRNGYDVLHRRAVTTTQEKTRIAARVK